MATRHSTDIIVVPPEKRLTLRDQTDDVFIQSEDADVWERPSQAEASMLANFLTNQYAGAPKRFWNVRTGVRIGYNSEGVFLHEKHLKRYFALDRRQATLDLRNTVPEAVPMVNARGETLNAGTATEQVLGKMLDSLPKLSDDMYYHILHASFQRADSNGNGKLSRPELGAVLRRVLNTLKTVDIEVVMDEADTDGDGQINYDEFAAYLRKSANDKVSKSFVTSLSNEADIVRATFRLWDKDGDGLIPNGHLCRALARLHPEMTAVQVRAFVRSIDSDNDGNVDYDEFVDFLFKRPML